MRRTTKIVACLAPAGCLLTGCASPQDVKVSEANIINNDNVNTATLAAQQHRAATGDIEGLRASIAEMEKRHAETQKELYEQARDALSLDSVLSEVASGVAGAAKASGNPIAQALGGILDGLSSRLELHNQEYVNTRLTPVRDDAREALVTSTRAQGVADNNAAKLADLESRLAVLSPELRTKFDALRGTLDTEINAIRAAAVTPDQLSQMLNELLLRQGLTPEEIQDLRRTFGVEELLTLLTAVGAGGVAARVGPSRGKKEVEKIENRLDRIERPAVAYTPVPGCAYYTQPRPPQANPPVPPA